MSPLGAGTEPMRTQPWANAIGMEKLKEVFVYLSRQSTVFVLRSTRGAY